MEVATILTIVVLSIMLPSADVLTDINLAVKLYTPPRPPGCVWYSSQGEGKRGRLRGIYEECREDPVYFCSHHENRQHCEFYDNNIMATVLLTPFLLNYIVCFYTFFRLTTDGKKYLFLFPLLNLYPQYEAAKLIYSIYKDPVKGKKEKKDYDQNIGLHEVFLESVPTALIITVIGVRAGIIEPSLASDLLIGDLPELPGAVSLGRDQDVRDDLPPEILLVQLGAEEATETGQVVHVGSQDQFLDVLTVSHLELIEVDEVNDGGQRLLVDPLDKHLPLPSLLHVGECKGYKRTTEAPGKACGQWQKQSEISKTERLVMNCFVFHS